MPTTPPADLHAVLTVEQLWQPVPGGSGTYIRELVGALRDEPGVTVSGVAARHGEGDGGLGVPVVRSALPRTALYETWTRLRRARVPVRDADVLHATTWAVPPRSAPLVVTVHDLAFLRTPEHFTPRGNRWFRRALDVVRHEADAVVVPSTATGDDCLAAGIDRARLHVVPHGVRVPRPSEQDVQGVRARHGLDRPYLLWCGTLEPRKNLPRLLAAYAAAAPDLPDVDLVLVGPTGWGDTQQVVDSFADHGPGRVHRVGHVGFDELHALYAGARAFCFPSTWEGFGMPVLEAMAHGVPVVTSAGTSMAEVAGDAALLVDPSDTDALADALVRAVGPEHDRLAVAGLDRAARATWRSAAQRTADVYRAVR